MGEFEALPNGRFMTLFYTSLWLLLWFLGDWSEVFYPGGNNSVAGPDDDGHGVNWNLDGHAGDVSHGNGEAA